MFSNMMANERNRLMGRATTIVGHAALAAMFFFLLEYFGMGASVETSIGWALFFAAAAGLLAWKQT